MAPRPGLFAGFFPGFFLQCASLQRRGRRQRFSRGAERIIQSAIEASFCILFAVSCWAGLITESRPYVTRVTDLLKYHARLPENNLVNKDLVVDSIKKPPAVSKIAQTAFEVAF
jgi:hypothetical protein